jgi:predicted permease
MIVAATPLRTMFRTFVATFRSICTAVTMALVGYYLHRTNSIGIEGKRTLAVLSQKVTIPLFLFTKIIFCKQDRSDDPCPDVTQSLADVWLLLLWPVYVVGIGCLVGLFIAKVTSTPRHHASTVLAACAFGNASALPITLLNVIYASVPPTSDFGRIDPTLFLSVFMLLYPALLWGLGGWLLDSDLTTGATTTAVAGDNPQNLEMSYLSNSHLHRNRIPHLQSGTTDEVLDRPEE